MLWITINRKCCLFGNIVIVIQILNHPSTLLFSLVWLYSVCSIHHAMSCFLPIFLMTICQLGTFYSLTELLGTCIHFWWDKTENLFHCIQPTWTSTFVLYYFGTLKSKRPLVIIFTPHLCTGMGTFSSQLESFIPSPHHQFGNETVCVVVKTCTWRQGYCNESVVSWSQLCSNNLPGRCPVQMKQVIRSRFALGWLL